MKYELYYKDILIGNLDVSNNTIKYTANKENINNLDEDENMILNFLKEDMDYLHPFLEMRIDKLKKFNLKSVAFPTDNYKLMISE